MIRPLTNEDEL
jgi:hypothetical protein